MVGICQIDLLIPENASLKDKRSVLRRITERVRGAFNVSIAEVGDHDLWQRTRLGLCVVANEREFVNSVLDRVLNFIERLQVADIVDHQIELINL